MQQVASRLANRQLAAAFYAWQDTVHQRQHARELAHKFMLRLQQSSKVGAKVDVCVESISHKQA